MFGFSANVEPNCLRSRILYFILVMFSIFGISDFISNMTEINFVNNEVPLVESIEDIFEKNISTYNVFTSWDLKRYIGSTLGNNQKLLNASIIFTNLTEHLLNYEVIIATDTLDDNFLIRFQQHKHNLWRYVRLDMDLSIFLKSIFFRTNSPFLSKYALAHNRISEFGLEKK